MKSKSLRAFLALGLIAAMFYYVYLPQNRIENLVNSIRFASKHDLRSPQYGTEDFLINTPGCYIPNYAKTIHFIEAKEMKSSCYHRIVFVDKVSDHEIKFRIDQTKTKQNVTASFKCCYKFVSRSVKKGKEDKKITYTKCMPFENGTVTILKEEVLTVYCGRKFNKNIVFTYEDAYIILKKQRTKYLKLQVKEDDVVKKENWNVLIVGMDTMSRARAHHSIPKTVRYMRERGWLDYRGYQKVDDFTFGNMMAVLTGKNLSKCDRAGRSVERFRRLLIWNRFRDAGYVTAYGEDLLNQLYDTFTPRNGFKTPPTDHYIRPLFLTGEHRVGNVVCTKSRPSAQHILDYALQFAKEYKNGSFFGFFWFNTYSHDLQFLPTLFENNLITFFENLREVGVLDNTFVIFLSDHGIGFGKTRFQTEAYYDERLPMLFMWVPHAFRETYPEEYHTLKLNQYRLTTPYDLHATLWEFMKMTSSWIDIVPPEACPQCNSLMKEISPNRTCADVHVAQKWCTCHTLTDATYDPAANRSLEIAAAFVQNRSKSVKTKECTICSPLILETVLRKHSYTDGNKTYYVVAFMFSSGSAFEATVENYDDKFNILPPTTTITPYNTKGYCVVMSGDRPYCACLNKCVKKRKYRVPMLRRPWRVTALPVIKVRRREVFKLWLTRHTVNKICKFVHGTANIPVETTARCGSVEISAPKRKNFWCREVPSTHSHIPNTDENQAVRRRCAHRGRHGA